ncbi:hypothetical protein MMC29_005296 [Sticta canariensis]|nr:hypothetical protein [Sticta canariensis]
MHFATFSKVILPIVFMIDGTVSTPTVNERTTGEATFQVYALPGCGKAGKDQQTKIYQLPDRECVDTPPIPKVDARFLSYKTKINDGVTASSCFFDVYPYKNCTGNFSGFESAPENSDKCQNVLQGFTGIKETYGAKSVRVSCRRQAA